MPVIDLNKIRTEKHPVNRIKDACKKAKTKVTDTIIWVRDNPENTVAILGGATAAIKAISSIGKRLTRNAALRQEKYNKERYIYDRSLNTYVKIKRKLTQSDFVKINQMRKKTGKKVSEILSDLDLVSKR